MLTLFPRGSLFDTPFTPFDYSPRPLITRRSFLTDPFDQLWDRIGTPQAPRILERSPDLPVVEQTDEGYACRIATPGVKRSQLQLSLQGERTVILAVTPEPKGVASSEKEETGASTVAINDDTAKGASDSAEGIYFTAATLPHDADMSRVTSSYSDGMLTVSVPRRTAPPEEEDSEEVAALATEVKAKRARVEELEQQLQEKRARFEEAATELRGARREERRKRATVRRTLAIADAR